MWYNSVTIGGIMAKRVKSRVTGMARGKPISIRKFKATDGHRIESRTYRRDIIETFCNEPRCKFYKKHAAQGICHSRDSLTGLSEKDLKMVYENSRKVLEEFRLLHKRRMSTKKYMDLLESRMVTDWMNQTFTLDELVRTRAEMSRLKLKLGKYR
jgi:hypothetical protein